METLRCYVTGGSGHLGANLVRGLLEAGHEVSCLVRNDVRALDGLNVETVSGDLLSVEDMAGNMKGCDVVFHAAAFVAVEKSDTKMMEEINVGGVRSMARAALSKGVDKFIHVSSVHAFSQRPTNEPLTESRPLVNSKKAAPYDRTKSAGQREIQKVVEEGLDATILHPTGILGPFDWKPSRMGKVLLDMHRGKMPIAINAGFNWVDVRDVSNTCISAVTKGRCGQNYLVPGHWESMKEISTLCGRKPWFTAPFWSAYLALPFAAMKSTITRKRPSFSRGSLHALAIQCKDIPGTLAREELGHQNRPLSETVSDAIDWFRAQGKLR
ncbi:MAG: NAD-dependent epimerase/dehydratase family protein [Candidatus Thermoplasmatota archaeon]|nr:NAD-dependent epimerase/dehydratase family protein [Candidatus Thermoplasmatota archaeon]